MKAAMVENHGGFYQMNRAGSVEDWDEVLDAADEVVFIEDLKGWGDYTKAYAVKANGYDYLYFVEE